MKNVSRKQWRMVKALLSSSNIYEPKSINKEEAPVEGKGCGAVVVNNSGKILLGQDTRNNLWCTPGGHVDPKEDFETAVIRELKEETNIDGENPDFIGEGNWEGNKSKVFVIRDFEGKPKDTKELKNLKFVDPVDMPWDKMRKCSKDSIKMYLENQKEEVKKSIKIDLALELLSKNLNRPAFETSFEMSHGDALRLVGTGLFRFLRSITRDMTDESFKEVKFDVYTLSIRKHINDIYSGKVVDGHKVVHSFTQRTLPEITAELMSVFEWYSPEDEPILNTLVDDNIKDNSIENGLNVIVDQYKKNNLANIYEEMEHIREEIRMGAAVDVQQVEIRLMKLFDKLEDTIKDITIKHNELARKAGSDLDVLETKLRELQDNIDSINNKSQTIEAFSANPPSNPDKIIDDYYCYLTKPIIEISPNGKIRISFNNDWTMMEKENFLNDMKAKILKKKK